MPGHICLGCQFSTREYWASSDKTQYLLTVVASKLGQDFDSDIEHTCAMIACNHCGLHLLRPYQNRPEWSNWQIQDGAGVFDFEWAYLYEKLLQNYLLE